MFKHCYPLIENSSPTFPKWDVFWTWVTTNIKSVKKTKTEFRMLTWRFLSSTIRVIWIFFLPISKRTSSTAKEDYGWSLGS